MHKYYVLILVMLAGLLAFRQNKSLGFTPIIFSEYGVQINGIEKLGDTVYYEKSAIEKFKFVFYERMGKCYCERFIKGKIFQKGNYENSLDTLKQYVSSRNNHGATSPITVRTYFEPLRNGIWVTYKGKKEIKENYIMGLLQKE